MEFSVRIVCIKRHQVASLIGISLELHDKLSPGDNSEKCHLLSQPCNSQDRGCKKKAQQTKMVLSVCQISYFTSDSRVVEFFLLSVKREMGRW